MRGRSRRQLDDLVTWGVRASAGRLGDMRGRSRRQLEDLVTWGGVSRRTVQPRLAVYVNSVGFL